MVYEETHEAETLGPIHPLLYRHLNLRAYQQLLRSTAQSTTMYVAKIYKYPLLKEYVRDYSTDAVGNSIPNLVLGTKATY